MSATLVSTCMPCLYTPEELASINRQRLLAASSASSSKHNHSQEYEKNIDPLELDKRRRPRLNYNINWNRFSTENNVLFLLKSTFVQSDKDRETKEWLSLKANPSTFKQMASDFFCQFFGRTSANGLAFRGEMFVFSQKQIRNLLKKREEVNEGKITIFSHESDEQQRDVEAKTRDPEILSRYQLPVHQQNATSMIDQDFENDLERVKEENRKIFDEIQIMLNKQKNKNANKNFSLLDIGAGDGGVTKIISPFFDQVFTTEDNPVMRFRLKNTFGWNSCFSSEQTSDVLSQKIASTSTSISYGYDESSSKNFYNTIALLNVLDRCSQPLTLLKEIRQHLLLVEQENIRNNNHQNKPFLIIAVVLPFCPFVENGSKQEKPSEILNMHGGGFCSEGASFESSLEKLVLNVFIPSGFKVCSWTRVPYLSEGDSRNSYYCLDDSLFLLEAV